MHGPRWVHKIIAASGGYFWLPCPVCEQEFGGHELVAGSHMTSIPTGPSRGIAICPDCTRVGEGCRAWSKYGNNCNEHVNQ